MKLVRVAKIRLDVPFQELKPTFDAYTRAFNLVAQRGWMDSDCNGVSLHRKTYQDCRALGLPAQLAITSRMKATEALLSVKELQKQGQAISCPNSRRCGIRLDRNSYTLWMESRTVSFLAMDKRRKLKFVVPAYFERYMDWKPTSAELVGRNDQVFLHVSFEKEFTDVPPTGRLVGVDRGVKKLAVTSDNRFFGGGRLKKAARKYQEQRSQLQAKKTRSAQRHLAEVRGKERRFGADVNHCISKDIVDGLQSGDTIVLEDLSGIRERAGKFRKPQKAAINRWPFFQLEQFLTYKAMAKGIGVVYVDARYTSQRCSRCGSIKKSNRRCQSIFKCRCCGFSHNADLNAAKNICLKYLDATGYPGTADVNQPNDKRTLLVNAPLQSRGSSQTRRSLATG